MKDSHASLALIFILWLAAVLGCAGGNVQPASPNVITKASPDFNLLEAKPTWKKGGFGSVALWQVTFRNNSKRPIGNIKYRTVYSAETGAVVSRGGTDSLMSKDTLQKVIQPGETRGIEINDGFINSEAHTAGFEVVSWEYLDSAIQPTPAPKKR